MIIQKEGRKPYDATIPRSADQVYTHVMPRETNMPANYISIQKSINCNNGFINEDILGVYLEKLKDRGFYAVDPDNFDKGLINVGDRMAYITKDNVWRSGGFLVDIKYSYTKYGEEEDQDETNTTDRERKPYILYKAFNHALFSLQPEDVKVFWVKRKREQNARRTPLQLPKFTIPSLETNYPVFLMNNDGNYVVVYYAKDNYSRNRFMTSEKFKRAQTEGWIFTDGTQGENFIEDTIVIREGADDEDED